MIIPRPYESQILATPTCDVDSYYYFYYYYCFCALFQRFGASPHRPEIHDALVNKTEKNVIIVESEAVRLNRETHENVHYNFRHSQL